MQNLIKLSRKTFMLVFLFNFSMHAIAGFFSMYSFIIFSDMFGPVIGFIMLVVCFLASRTAAKQVDSIFFAFILALAATKNGVVFKDVIDKKEKFSIQVGDSSPIEYDPIEHKWSAKDESQ